MIDYYTFRKFIVRVGGQKVTVFGKAGVWSWQGLNPGTEALLAVTDVRPDDVLLDLGCGTGAIGAAAGVLAPQGRAVLVDCHTAAVSCAQRTVEANHLPDAEARLGDGVLGLEPSCFDLVLSHLPRGRAVQEALVHGAAWTLRPGGRFYFVAHRDVGIKSAVDYARELFGRCGVIKRKKGYHVAMTIKPRNLTVSPPDEGYVGRSVVVDDVETRLVSKPGVFAWDRLDEGARRLIETMAIDRADTVLDLGCGTGLVGVAAARRASQGQVVLLDADVRAVESSRRTLVENGIANAEVLLSDCASAVRDHRFDCVVTNPPFHQGAGVDYDVAHQFVRDAAQVLKPGGRLYLVANRFLAYDDLIRDVFGAVDVAYADNGYHVLVTRRLHP